MSVTSPVPHERVPEPKVRLFAGDGAFLFRATPAQVDGLLRAGAAEWRGGSLRMIGTGGRRGLDGLHITRRETPENVRGCYAFATRTMPEEGA